MAKPKRVKRKNPAAVALGKRRTDKLTKAERSALAKRAATARWGKARASKKPNTAP